MMPRMFAPRPPSASGWMDDCEFLLAVVDGVGVDVTGRNTLIYTNAIVENDYFTANVDNAEVSVSSRPDWGAALSLQSAHVLCWEYSPGTTNSTGNYIGGDPNKCPTIGIAQRLRPRMPRWTVSSPVMRTDGYMQYPALSQYPAAEAGWAFADYSGSINQADPVLFDSLVYRNLSLLGFGSSGFTLPLSYVAALPTAEAVIHFGQQLVRRMQFTCVGLFRRCLTREEVAEIAALYAPEGAPPL